MQLLVLAKLGYEKRTSVFKTYNQQKSNFLSTIHYFYGYFILEFNNL